MASKKSRPLLYDYFKHTADVMLEQYKRSQMQGSPSNLGINREFFFKTFLSSVLPPRLTVRQGEIWDSRGNKTGQLEVVILRDDAASLEFGGPGGADTYLAEGVFAVMEIKSKLTRVKLREALRGLTKVKSLNVSNSVAMSIGPVMHRPLRCIFSYEGTFGKALKEELKRPENADVADLVCVLDKGILVSSEIISMLHAVEIKQPYFLRPGKAASLGLFYYYLMSFSTSFMASGLDLGPYFDPYSGWGDI